MYFKTCHDKQLAVVFRFAICLLIHIEKNTCLLRYPAFSCYFIVYCTVPCCNVTSYVFTCHITWLYYFEAVRAKVYSCPKFGEAYCPCIWSDSSNREQLMRLTLVVLFTSTYTCTVWWAISFYYKWIPVWYGIKCYILISTVYWIPEISPKFYNCIIFFKYDNCL